MSETTARTMRPALACRSQRSRSSGSPRQHALGAMPGRRLGTSAAHARLDEPLIAPARWPSLDRSTSRPFGARARRHGLADHLGELQLAYVPIRAGGTATPRFVTLSRSSAQAARLHCPSSSVARARPHRHPRARRPRSAPGRGRGASAAGRSRRSRSSASPTAPARRRRSASAAGIASAELEWPGAAHHRQPRTGGAAQGGVGLRPPDRARGARRLAPGAARARSTAMRRSASSALDGRLRPVPRRARRGGGRAPGRPDAPRLRGRVRRRGGARRHRAGRRCAISREAVAYLRGERDPPEPPPPADDFELLAGMPDLADVRGQERARRALEIAAAGAHNLLFAGPPGTGKTMLARRLPGILPPLDDEAALEVTRIHSVAGVLAPGAGLVRVPPFRAPHHTASAAAVIGGGGGSPRPGRGDPRPPRRAASSTSCPSSRGRCSRRCASRSRTASSRSPASAGVPSSRRGSSSSATMNLCPCGGARRPCASTARARRERVAPLPREAVAGAARPVRPRRSPCRARARDELAARRRRGVGAPSASVSLAARERLAASRRRRTAEPADELLTRAVERLPLSGRGRARVARGRGDDRGARRSRARSQPEHVAEALSYRPPRELDRSERARGRRVRRRDRRARARRAAQRAVRRVPRGVRRARVPRRARGPRAPLGRPRAIRRSRRGCGRSTTRRRGSSCAAPAPLGAARPRRRSRSSARAPARRYGSPRRARARPRPGRGGRRRRLGPRARHRRRGAPRRARGRRRDGRRARAAASTATIRARTRRSRRRSPTRGLIVSEYPPGVEPAPWRFPARNRIVAGLCRRDGRRRGARAKRRADHRRPRARRGPRGARRSRRDHLAALARDEYLLRLGASRDVRRRRAARIGIDPVAARRGARPAARAVRAAVADAPAGADELVTRPASASVVAAALAELELAAVVEQPTGSTGRWEGRTFLDLRHRLPYKPASCPGRTAALRTASRERGGRGAVGLKLASPLAVALVVALGYVAWAGCSPTIIRSRRSPT